jgi:hypothetical protein
MSKIQSRRSISFARADFDAAQAAATKLGVPLAQLAGQALRDLVARNPHAEEISPGISLAFGRPIAAQVVIDELRQGSPFRVGCQLAGCGAAPGQACQPVPTSSGGPDPELAKEVVHQNRLWQVEPRHPVTATVEFTPPAIDADAVAKMVADRVGVLPRAQLREISSTTASLTREGREISIPAGVRMINAAPGDLTVADIRRISDRLAEAENRSPRNPDGNVLIPIAPGSPFDRMANGESIEDLIAENGIEAELEDLDQEMDDQVRVVYDEDA